MDVSASKHSRDDRESSRDHSANIVNMSVSGYTATFANGFVVMTRKYGGHGDKGFSHEGRDSRSGLLNGTRHA